MAEETKMFTQEEVDAIVGNRLSREKLKIEELSLKFNELNTQYAEASTKIRDYETQLSELPTLKRQAIINEVALSLKVPDKLIGRLKGETKEEVEADAKELMTSLELLGKDEYKGLPKTPDGKGEVAKTGYALVVDHMSKK